MKIRIEIENGKLVITNPVHPRKNEAPSGVGLQNLSNRCKLMLCEEIEKKKQDNLFIVKVPLYE